MVSHPVSEPKTKTSVSNEPDHNEIIKRSFKYLIQWLAIAVAAKFIPTQPLNIKEVLMIAVVGAATFALLDMYAPTVSQGVRHGVGFAIGVKTLTI